MIWYLILGYLAACYLWGMYVVARLYTGRRLRALLRRGTRVRRAGAPVLRLTDAPMPRPILHMDMPQSEAA